MINPLLMVSKQLSEFEKGQIMAYDDCGLSLSNIAKKFDYRHLSIDVFLKNYKETGNYYQKEACDCKRKTTTSEDTKIVWAANKQHTATTQQLKD